jgi:VWFA-related protein
MKDFTGILLFLASTFSSPLFVPGQSQSKPEPQNPDTIVVEKSEVVLDAVVRDKKGRPITNLTVGDFAVYEDGVRQQISSFRLVTRGEVNSAAHKAEGTPANQKAEKQTPASAASPAPGLKKSPAVIDNEPGAVAMVFDRLSPGARSRAHTAALTYLAQGLTPDDYVGVFTLDHSLKVLQSFTNDPQLIRKAIDLAEQESSSVYTDSTSQIIGLSRQYESAIVGDDIFKRGIADSLVGMGRGDEARNVINQGPEHRFEMMVLEAAIRAAENLERLERDQQGYATTDALLAIIDGMSKLPRRKALLFFSEGVAVTSNTAANFRAVISNANRGSVSVYPIDAAGLRAESSDVVLGQAMTALGQRRITQAAHGGDSNLGAMTKDLERNEDLIRRNPASGLSQLADQTGGVFVNNTNDPGARLRQVNEDLHSYYLLSYSPRNKNYDGNFRQTTVNVSRSGLEVQSRKGYFALGESYDSPVLDYEAPALAILSGQSQPNAFETRAGAFSFPEPANSGVVPVVVEVPPGAIHFLVDNAKTKYSADFSIVALIRDQAGHVARKLSSHYLLSGSYDKLDLALNGNILFYKETKLGPGRYSVSSVVYDALAKTWSTSSASLIVPTAEKNSLRLSSIVLVKNGEHLSPANQQASRLFRFNELLLYPNLGEPLSKSEDKELTLFLTAYTPGEASATKLSLEITQSGRIMSQLSNDLPAADQNGRIQYASAIPLDQFQPGNYALNVTVQNAKSRATNSTLFTINP